MDKRARQIVLNTFWRTSGWKSDSERAPSPEDFAYAKSKGLMFDPVHRDHAEALRLLFEERRKLSRRVVADAFLASLSTRRLDWRSALGSYAVFEHLPEHAPSSSDGMTCDTCGFWLKTSEQDLNVLSFERLKWGGVRHLHVPYAALDLGLFLRDPAPAPTVEDVRIFKGVFAAIEEAPSDITSAALQSRLSRHLKSNKAERDVLVAILGYCGILGTQEHRGFGDRFIPPAERELPGRHFVDMPYPACWWRSSDGVNRTALESFFGHVL